MAQKITPCLWFDTHTEEAIKLYSSCFNGVKMVSIKRYPDGYTEGPLAGMEGKVLTAIFELAGQRFMALDGGPTFKFTPAISFFVNCETTAEVDHLWATLSEGGTILMPLQAYPFSEKFGWTADRFGVNWQINLGPRAQKITPFLMFVGEQHGKAQEALHFYQSLFSNSGTERVQDEDATPEANATQQTVFQLHGQDFMALDSSFDHAFTFNEALSLYIECDSQAEVDHFWHALSAHPQAEQCGWLKDRYGVSWQVVPSVLSEFLEDLDPEKARRAMDAMMQMKKIDIAALEQARAG